MTAEVGEAEVLAALGRLAELLARIGEPRAATVAETGALHGRDQAAFWQALNANAWWAGAGSLAAATMADNPGLPQDRWQREVHEFRELLIEIGEALMRRGGENPGISSWVLAFRNWDAAGV